MDVSVEVVAGDEQQEVLAAPGQRPIGREDGGEKRQEVEAMKDYGCFLPRNMAAASSGNMRV